jgi:uncharacterized protein YkwD
MKRIISIAIVGMVILFGGALLWPNRAEEIASNVFPSDVVNEVRSGSQTSPAERTVGGDIDTALSVLLRDNKKEGNRLAIADIVDETNKERIKAGFEPLRANVILVESAKIKTEDMIDLEYFEHQSPSGKSVSDLGKDVGYDYIIMGENLAMGDFKNAKDLVTAWMNSPGHRANMLNPEYQDIGVYAAEGLFDGQSVWFAVQHFGTQRAVCPTISKTLKNDIDTLNEDLDKQQQAIEDLKNELEEFSVESGGYDDKVNLFNAMVTAYNKQLEVSKNKIVDYNKQVASFNTCLLQYQH